MQTRRWYLVTRSRGAEGLRTEAARSGRRFCNFSLGFRIKLHLHVPFIKSSGTAGHTCRHMSRSSIEIYWGRAETAPEGVIAQVRVADNWGSDYLLPYPCELTKEGWVNAASGKPLAVRVTYWKPYVETLPKSKPGRRSPTNTPPQRTDTERD